MNDAQDIAAAKRQALLAKARMDSSLGAVKQRLSPSALAADAREKVRSATSGVASKATDAVRSRPTTAKAIAGAAALVLLRKPIGGIFRALFGKKTRQRRSVRRSEKKARREAARTGSELPPTQLIPDPPEIPVSPKSQQE